MKRGAELKVLALTLVLLVFVLLRVSVATSEPDYQVYLPQVFCYDCAGVPTPTPVSEIHHRWIQNNSGMYMYYQVHGTGIGRKLFYEGGSWYYGSFPAGQYTMTYNLWCGQGTSSHPFPPGTWRFTFTCERNKSDTEYVPVVLRGVP